MTVVHEGHDHELHVYLVVTHDDGPPTEVELKDDES